MTNASHHKDDQLQERLTVLERVVGMMNRDSLIKSGKDASNILAFRK